MRENCRKQAVDETGAVPCILRCVSNGICMKNLEGLCQTSRGLKKDVVERYKTSWRRICGQITKENNSTEEQKSGSAEAALWVSQANLRTHNVDQGPLPRGRLGDGQTRGVVDGGWPELTAADAATAEWNTVKSDKKMLRDGELNPGLPRDKR